MKCFHNSSGLLLGTDVFPSTRVYNISPTTGQATARLTMGSGNIVAVVEERKGSGAVQTIDEVYKEPVHTIEELKAMEESYRAGKEKAIMN